MTAPSLNSLWRPLGIATAVLFLAAVPAASGAPAGETEADKEKGPEAKIVASSPITLAGGFATGTATANCPKGTVAISGGYQTTAPTIGAQWIDLYESQRAGQRAWRASGVQLHAGSGTLTSYAYCEPLKTKVRTRSTDVPLGGVNATATGLATCPGGTKVLGGGFAVPAANSASSSYVSRSVTGNKLGWVVDATRFTGTEAASMSVSVYCAEVGKIKTRSDSAAVLGSTGAQTAATPACPAKTPLRGGGFATSTPIGGLAGSALVYESRPDDQSWVSSAAPGGLSASSTLVSNSYCR